MFGDVPGEAISAHLVSCSVNTLALFRKAIAIIRYIMALFCNIFSLLCNMCVFSPWYCVISIVLLYFAILCFRNCIAF